MSKDEFMYMVCSYPNAVLSAKDNRRIQSVVENHIETLTASVLAKLKPEASLDGIIKQADHALWIIKRELSLLN